VEFFEDIVVLEILGGLALELFDVGSCAEGLLHFTEEEDDLNVLGGFVTADCFRDGCPHGLGKGVVV
jgi:hypothetical protein